MIGLTLVSCQPRRDQAPEPDDRPVLMVTIEPLRYFTEAVAGPRFRVESMVPKGSSPETYDPTPQQLVRLNHSRAYLGTGHLGFELNWMDRLRQNAPHLLFFDTSEGLSLIEGHHHNGHEAGVEPHIWLSARNARIVVANISQALCTLDSRNANEYRERADSLSKVLVQTDSTLSRILADSLTTRAFLIYHPSLSYFARDYGLTQLAIEDEGKEPSPAHLKQLITRGKQERVKVIFIQPEFDARNAEIIARQTNARLVSINPLAYDWPTEMTAIARALVHPEQP